jgi:hypothetical protein
MSLRCIPIAWVVFATVLVLGATLGVDLQAELIEPTRTLERPREAAGMLTVTSEPPGLEAVVDGQIIGQTPVFAVRFPAGIHVLRIQNAEADIYIAPGKTTAVSWFKGSFIKIPETAKLPTESAKEPQPPLSKPKPDEGQGDRQDTAKDPYYWPLNPRGPIYQP